MRVLDSRALLSKLGYDFVVEREEGVEPDRVDTRFIDIVPQLGSVPELRAFAEQRMYRHQLEAFNALSRGANVVLRAGTGSGKTEAWVMYFLKRAAEEDFRCIAVYPTLALANDQVRRITMYSQAVGVRVQKLDALTRSELVKSVGLSGLRRRIAESRIVITNPAFLLHEIKKIIVGPSRALLRDYLSKLSMAVFDEIDFYSPRSLALILAMIEVMSLYSDRKPQIVILTATLANSEDVCRFLEEKTGRECVVIEGKPFRVENRVFIVLGKELKNLWLRLREHLPKLASMENVDRDIIEALTDFSKFRENAYRVISYLQALGIHAPSPGLSVEEILAGYVDDEGVTLVFTRSIARAEELAKRVQERLRSSRGEEAANAVATHHHLVPKTVREAIEEGARSGRIKVVVSPRTLMQGIDIGTIVRVVHVGLPESVREFLQREGRKGRRREIPFTETIIVPSTRWDWELLSKGFDALRKWLSMPLEKTAVNPSNKYLILFRALAKVLSPWMRGELTREEVEVLKSVGVIRKSGVDDRRARWIWERLNFYEFGPPYGVKRYIETSMGTLKPLEPIGHCDLVERFQVGCFDIGNDAIVTQLRFGRSSRIVTAVIEKPLKLFSYREHDAIAEAIEEYRFIKSRWGEEPSLLRDIARGKLFSYVHCVVYPPRTGFGELHKVPNRVIWLLTSDRPRVFRVGDRHVVSYERKTIYVPVNTGGEYRDFTYGIVIETQDSEDATTLRLGLALLMIVLRRVFGIAFETIMYGVERIGEKKFIELHEPEAAGLIESLDWRRVRRAIEEYQPDDLDYVLLQMLDEIGYSEMLALGLDWDYIKRAALRVVDYILARESVEAAFRGKKISIPKPSRGLRIIALDTAAIPLDEEEAVPKVFTALAVFDGEEARVASDLYVKIPFAPPPRSLRDLEAWLEDAVYYEGYKLVVFDRSAVVRDLQQSNLVRLQMLVEKFSTSVADAFRSLGIEPVSLPTIIESVELEGVEKPRIVHLDEVHRRVVEVLTRVRESEILPGRATEAVLKEVSRYLESRARAIYIAYLVAEALQRERGS